MLVKFLSYIATIIGTKRYKPLVFSGLAIAISLIGVLGVWSVYEQPHGTAASTVQQAEDPTKETLSEQTPSKRSTRDTTATQQQTTQSQASATPTTTGTPSSTTPTAPIIQTTNDGTLTLKKGATSALLTYTLSDSSQALWSVTADSANGPTIVSSQDSTAATSFSFSLKADQIYGNTYTFTIHAKDSARALDLTKTITVTVPKD